MKCCHKHWQKKYLNARLSWADNDGNVVRFVSRRFINIAAGLKGSAPAGW
jgi:hypothetical protein